MPRPKGTRDADYEVKRRELLHGMNVRLMRREVARPSLRDLAHSAGVTTPTLRHYFGGRREVLDAILEENLRLGRAGLEAQGASEAPFAESIAEYARNLVRALTAERDVRLGDIFAVSLAEGFLDEGISDSTLRHIVDPTIETLERRLAAHVERGEMTPTDLRAAALLLISPLLVAALHQHQLNGARSNPLSLMGLADAASAAFVRAFEVRPQGAPAS